MLLSLAGFSVPTLPALSNDDSPPSFYEFDEGGVTLALMMATPSQITITRRPTRTVTTLLILSKRQTTLRLLANSMSRRRQRQTTVSSTQKQLPPTFFKTSVVLFQHCHPLSLVSRVSSAGSARLLLDLRSSLQLRKAQLPEQLVTLTYTRGGWIKSAMNHDSKALPHGSTWTRACSYSHLGPSMP